MDFLQFISSSIKCIPVGLFLFFFSSSLLLASCVPRRRALTCVLTWRDGNVVRGLVACTLVPEVHRGVWVGCTLDRRCRSVRFPRR